jgi:DNA-binding transcriptional LysR family regulator
MLPIRQHGQDVLGLRGRRAAVAGAMAARPALTRQLAAIGRPTGLRLLHRGHSGVRLAPAGQRFLLGAQQVGPAYDQHVGGASARTPDMH